MLFDEACATFDEYERVIGSLPLERHSLGSVSSESPHISNPIAVVSEFPPEENLVNEIEELSLAAVDEIESLGPDFIEKWNDRLVVVCL